VKKFTILLLNVILVTLIAGSVQSIYADHILEDGKGIFKDENQQNFTKTIDSNSKYQIHLHTEVRNAQGQLIGIAETDRGNYIPHEISDLLFYEHLDVKPEIVIIDNIKYEKVQYAFSPTLEQRWMGMYPIFEEIRIKFNFEGDALVQLNKQNKDYSLWKIHYCADFSSIGHDGLQCIPIFQVLIPTMTLEPTDVITHHWTILRAMN